MIPGFLKNAVINAALKRVAASGDVGSTILGTLVTLLLAEKIDWDLAFKIFSVPDMPAALEAGKILGVVLLWVISYICGKKKLVEPQQETRA